MVTEATNLDPMVGLTTAVRGELTRTEIPTILGVDV